MPTNKDKSLLDLLVELAQLHKGAIYEHEMLVTYPAVNQALNLLDGIETLNKSKNYIGSVSLLRSLLETTMVLVYDYSVKKEPDHYKNFLQNGRLMRWSGKKWVKLRDDELIEHFERVTGAGIRAMYDKCCEVLHFSSRQMQLITPVVKDEKGRLANMIIGTNNDHIPQEAFDSITKAAKDCEVIMADTLRQMAKNKKSKARSS